MRPTATPYTSATISENLGRGLDGKGQIGDTKTESGERDVPLTAPALAALKAHRARQNEARLLLGEDYDDRGLVFATSRGTPFSERNVLRALKSAAKRAKLPESLGKPPRRRPPTLWGQPCASSASTCPRRPESRRAVPR
jgi:integrase